MRDSHRYDVAVAKLEWPFDLLEAREAFVMHKSFERLPTVICVIVAFERPAGDIDEREILGDREDQADTVDASAENPALVQKRCAEIYARAPYDVGAGNASGTRSG